jgi:sugar lactone lactonase YvrE
LYYPSGVAVDISGNIYIADNYNQRIREVTAATGIITTVAGNGTAGYSGDGGAATSAELYYPSGIAVDGSGNIYIADSTNNRIRKVTAATGVIATVAGNGTGGYSGDGGAATSAKLWGPSGVALDSSGNLYIADQASSRIRKMAAATGIITTVAGNGTGAYRGDHGPATSAELYLPSQINVAPSAAVLNR